MAWIGFLFLALLPSRSVSTCEVIVPLNYLNSLAIFDTTKFDLVVPTGY